MSDLIQFGDDDPEDGWDASDPVIQQLHNLIRRVHWFIEHHALEGELADRAIRLEDDLSFIRARVLNRDLD